MLRVLGRDAEGRTRISNVPHLQDVTTTMELLGRMGAELSMNELMQIEIDPGGLDRFEAAVNLCRRAVSLRPDFARAHNNLGAALTGAGCGQIHDIDSGCDDRRFAGR